MTNNWRHHGQIICLQSQQRGQKYIAIRTNDARPISRQRRCQPRFQHLKSTWHGTTNMLKGARIKLQSYYIPIPN